jgi:membrane peptidoglycan carboxypeptidase
VYGRTIPGSIWRQFMSNALRGVTADPFAPFVAVGTAPLLNGSGDGTGDNNNADNNGDNKDNNKDNKGDNKDSKDSKGDSKKRKGSDKNNAFLIDLTGGGG